MSLDVGDRGLALGFVVDEDFPAAFAPRGGEAAAFASVADQGMKARVRERTGGGGFEVAGNDGHFPRVLVDNEVGVIESDAAGGDRVVRIAGSLGEAAGDCVSLQVVEADRGILQGLSGQLT